VEAGLRSKKKIESESPEEENLISCLDVRTAGDPDKEDIVYTYWTPRELSSRLASMGTPVGRDAIATWLEDAGIRRRQIANVVADVVRQFFRTLDRRVVQSGGQRIISGRAAAIVKRSTCTNTAIAWNVLDSAMQFRLVISRGDCGCLRLLRLLRLE